MDSFYAKNLHYTNIAPVLVLVGIGSDIAAIIRNPFTRLSTVHNFTLHIQAQDMDSFYARNLLNYYTTLYRVLLLYLCS